jgi:hypothetical protein
MMKKHAIAKLEEETMLAEKSLEVLDIKAEGINLY